MATPTCQEDLLDQLESTLLLIAFECVSEKLLNKIKHWFSDIHFNAIHQHLSKIPHMTVGATREEEWRDALTGASITGAKMLLHLKLLFPQCQTLGDLGLQVLGKGGQIWGNIIQLGNFCLFMPCALRFCGLALKGVGNGIPGFDECVDYYVFVVAFVCLIMTQVRDFKHAQIFTVLSFCCVIGMIVSMLYAAFKYDNEKKIPASWFGNPEPEVGLRLIRVLAADGFEF